MSLAERFVRSPLRTGAVLLLSALLVLIPIALDDDGTMSLIIGSAFLANAVEAVHRGAYDRQVGGRSAF